MTLLIFFAALSLGVSFLCSLLEACLLSLPRGYVESLHQQGSRAGTKLREMQISIDRPLSAILTLNTVAHTLGAVGVGAQATEVFGDAGVGVASGVMTLLVLVLSEIIPKTMGATYARGLAVPVAWFLPILIAVCLPVLIPLEWISRMIGSGEKEPLSRAEIVATLRLGHKDGTIERREYEMGRNLIRLRTIPLSKVLTPRTVVFSLPEDTTVAEVEAEHMPLRFNRIPVYAEDPEHLSGYFLRSELHAAGVDGKKELRLTELKRPLPILPEQATVQDALDRMIQEREQIAMVVDEFGGMEGLVTLEDLLEELIGMEIVDETDAAPDMRALARRQRGRPEAGD